MKNESGFSLEIASQPFKKEIKKNFRLVDMMVDHTEERRKGPYWDVSQVLLMIVKIMGRTLTFTGSKLSSRIILIY